MKRSSVPPIADARGGDTPWSFPDAGGTVMSAVPQSVAPLVPGDKLSREEFLRRWEAMPHVKFAELIGGIVYMPSPLSRDHGTTDIHADTWLGTYAAFTPGT